MALEFSGKLLSAGQATGVPDARGGMRPLVQEYVKESHGSDVRALVVGGEVVASMRRKAHGSEFRSNFHLGGSVTGVDLTEEQRRIAILSAETLGLEVAGVDMLESDRGPLVLEVNSSPGLEGIECDQGKCSRQGSRAPKRPLFQ